MKFPPLIKARASSTNCTMGNVATQHTYIQSMLNLPRFISFYGCFLLDGKNYVTNWHFSISRSSMETIVSIFSTIFLLCPGVFCSWKTSITCRPIYCLYFCIEVRMLLIQNLKLLLIEKCQLFT
jgi:hypothetical protein